MLLAVDIGNTNINNGIFKGKTLRKTFRIPTYADGLDSKYIEKLRPYLKDIEWIVVVSVVPPILRKVEKIFRKGLRKSAIVVGRDVLSGIKNLYRKPSQVGQDRLVNARAAFELYGEAIVVDFGTAITIDVVNKKREYLGGVIAPGVEISLKALIEKAYLLPDVSVKRPKGILGKETRQSMISGAIYGFSSLCDGIVRRLKKRYCRNATVIATGGLSRLIGGYCGTIHKIDPELTLKGLEIIGEGCNV